MRIILPHLKCIIVYDDDVNVNSNDIISWKEVMELGKEDNDESEVLARQRRMAINQCCILVYTSGTTGNPKGKKGNNRRIILWWFSHINMPDSLRSYNF